VNEHPSSSIKIVAARVILLTLAAGALVAAVVVTRRAEHRSNAARLFYICPMHAEVASPVAGDCPICRMQLEPRPVVGATGAGVAAASALVSPAGTASHKDDRAPETFVLPPGAEIRNFEDLGYGKMYEMAREMRSPAWVETREIGQALLYRDEIALLAPAEEGLFFGSTHVKDGTPAGVKVLRIDEPPVPWDDATALVRFRVAPTMTLTPDQTGWVKFPTKVREVRAVRSTAIIQSASGPYVLLASKDKRTFTKRPIRIGSVLYGEAAVLSGLEVGERIATLNTFALDAERRFAGRAAP